MTLAAWSAAMAGTCGYVCSATRDNLRRHFEVDRSAQAAIAAQAVDGKMTTKDVALEDQAVQD
jgi:pyruvate dehydrogenase complex dehydrogenase (E1) component